MGHNVRNTLKAYWSALQQFYTTTLIREMTNSWRNYIPEEMFSFSMFIQGVKGGTD